MNTGITEVRCKISAEAFLQSDASAMHNTNKPDATTSTCVAAALGAHYLPVLTTTVFDYHNTVAKQGERMAGSSHSLEKYD